MTNVHLYKRLNKIHITPFKWKEISFRTDQFILTEMITLGCCIVNIAGIKRSINTGNEKNQMRLFI